jgi:hypothetical protein
LPAYQDISGIGTKVRRARKVSRILADQARLPDEGLGEFTKGIWAIIESAVLEATTSDEGLDKKILSIPNVGS